MTERRNTMTTNTIDWEAAMTVAKAPVLYTRGLVEAKDEDQVREWALQMASACGNSSAVNGPRAVSYYELAVLAGHVVPKPENAAERLAWIETQLGSMEAKVETIRDAVAAVVARQDQTEAAAVEQGEADDE
jgi:hypothetical protein